MKYTNVPILNADKYPDRVGNKFDIEKVKISNDVIPVSMDGHSFPVGRATLKKEKEQVLADIEICYGGASQHSDFCYPYAVGEVLECDSNGSVGISIHGILIDVQPNCDTRISPLGKNETI